MKRMMTVALALMALAGPVFAMQSVFNGQLVNAPVASTTSYVLDMKAQGIDYLSAQAVYSSATITTGTFIDGRKSTGTITVVSTNTLKATAGTDTITVAISSALAPTTGSNSLLVTSTTVALAGSSITIVTASSYTLVAGVDFSTTIVTTTGTAITIAAGINAKVENVTATVSGSSVIVTCQQAGVFCNSYIFNTSTQAALTVASPTFLGGNNNSSFNLNGNVLTQGVHWTSTSIASNTAISIAAAINTNVGYLFSASTTASTVVTITCQTKGTACNAYTLTVSTGALTISSSTFLGGVDNAFLLIQGTKLTQGTDWTQQTTASMTALSIAAAINANANTGAIIVSSESGTSATVFATSTVTGINSYTLFSSNASSITVSSNVFLNGAATQVDTTLDQINIVGHGMPTGLQVLVATPTTGTLPGGLVGGTTYFIVDPIQIGAATPDANNVKLSTGLVAATSNPPVTIDLTSQTGGGSFTLAPLTLNSQLGIFWEESNDQVNWVSVPSISSVTYSSTTASASTFWDFGIINPRQIRVTVNQPGAGKGAFNVTVTGNGKAIR